MELLDGVALADKNLHKLRKIIVEENLSRVMDSYCRELNEL